MDGVQEERAQTAGRFPKWEMNDVQSPPNPAFKPPRKGV
jgi:hypothetical protein